MSGRVRSVRLLGSKLMFLDIERDKHRLQVMVELKKLAVRNNLDEDFKCFKKVARSGDWICKSFSIELMACNTSVGLTHAASGNATPSELSEAINSTFAST